VRCFIAGSSANGGGSVREGETPVCNVSKYVQRVSELQQRIGAGSFAQLSQRQHELYNALQGVGTVMDRDEINHRMDALGYQECDRQTWPTDFCYNLVNVEDTGNKFLHRVALLKPSNPQRQGA
jgi:hypothetical protein